MLTKKQIEEIKEHLEKAQNPIFYYDNDADGLCSFLILRRYIGRGKGVSVRSYPDLDARYAKKAQELNSDYVFVLDKPVISKGFVEEIDKMQLPFVWIDHHDEVDEFSGKYDKFYAYNPAKNKGKDKSFEPVSYLAYKITGRKEDLWISTMGCIADCFMPDFAQEFVEKYPDYWGKVKTAFDAFYLTEIGKIAFALNFGLKDSITNVIQLQNFLIGCKGPEDVFLEVNANRNFRKKNAEIRKKYDLLLDRAKKNITGNLIFFSYAGETSMSSDLSNALYYFYPDKYIAVAYKNGGKINISMRGEGIKKILKDILKDFENSSGGGHEKAVGATIRASDLERFKEALSDVVNKK